jgi:allantoinase
VSQGPPFAYSPLPARPRLELPNGARVAVWIAVNVEHFEIDRPGVSIVPVTADLVPDPMNYGWRDYGARVGVWRLMELFDELELPVTAPLHSEVCNDFPQIVEEGTKRGWAWMAHGRTTAALQANMERGEERAYLADTIGTIETATGRRPRGWLGPALTETFNTPQLLAELGLSYVCDWCNDDQPYPLETRTGRIVSVPYSIEANDIPLLLVKGMTGPEYQQVLTDQFDALYAAGAATGQVMAIPLHPFLVGVPFRLRYLRAALEHILGHEDVWLTTGDDIADWYVGTL